VEREEEAGGLLQRVVMVTAEVHFKAVEFSPKPKETIQVAVNSDAALVPYGTSVRATHRHSENVRRTQYSTQLQVKTLRRCSCGHGYGGAGPPATAAHTCSTRRVYSTTPLVYIDAPYHGPQQETPLAMQQRHALACTQLARPPRAGSARRPSETQK
jgi:hypothetical protein